MPDVSDGRHAHVRGAARDASLGGREIHHFVHVFQHGVERGANEHGQRHVKGQEKDYADLPRVYRPLFHLRGGLLKVREVLVSVSRNLVARLPEWDAKRHLPTREGGQRGH